MGLSTKADVETGAGGRDRGRAQLDVVGRINPRSLQNKELSNFFRKRVFLESTKSRRRNVSLYTAPRPMRQSSVEIYVQAGRETCRLRDGG